MKNKELQNEIFDYRQSFHNDFKEIPWIIIHNIPYEYSEGDIMTIFEQYGTIVNFELVRDAATGKSKGTAIICYEDWRSTILAVDNLNGIKLKNRPIAVDHIKYQQNKKSNLVDPRTITPARLTQSQKDVVYDSGSASTTDYEYDYSETD